MADDLPVAPDVPPPSPMRLYVWTFYRHLADGLMIGTTKIGELKSPMESATNFNGLLGPIYDEFGAAHVWNVAAFTYYTVEAVQQAPGVKS